MKTNFIANIHYKVTKIILYELLIQFTPIKSLDYKSKIAFVEYFTVNDCEYSLDKMKRVKFLIGPLLLVKSRKNCFCLLSLTYHA